MIEIETAANIAALWFTGFFALCGLALIIGEVVRMSGHKSKDEE